MYQPVFIEQAIIYNVLYVFYYNRISSNPLLDVICFYNNENGYKNWISIDYFNF